MERDDLVDDLGLDEETLFLDDFDDCIVGVCELFGRPTVVAYDKDRILDKLCADGMTEDDAVEWFYYNQLGAWMGDFTPVFVTIIPPDDADAG